MFLSAGVFGVSVVLTIITLWLFARESRSGERLCLRGVRDRVDRGCMWVRAWIQRGSTIVNTFFLQLWWRYAVHVSLRTILVGMSRVYDRLIAYFEYNRQQAKTIKKQRRQWQQSSHLSAIADHKAATALSEREKQRRRRAALDE